MTSTFENETIDHCLTAYQHHVDYDKAFFIVLVHTKKKVLHYGNFFSLFGSQKLLFRRREATPNQPPCIFRHFQQVPLLKRAT